MNNEEFKLPHTEEELERIGHAQVFLQYGINILRELGYKTPDEITLEKIVKKEKKLT